DDAVRAFLLTATSEEAMGGVFNLGSDEVISLRDLAELLVTVAGEGSYELVPFPPDRKAIDIGDYYGDFSRIRPSIGWEPRIGLSEGLERTISFYRQHGSEFRDS